MLVANIYMKKILQNIKLVVVGIAIAVGASYVYASSTATDPTVVAPGNNMAIPVHQLTGAQVKTGGLSVNTFAAFQNSSLEQDSFFDGILKGISQGGNNSTVVFGSGSNPVDLVVNGGVNNTLKLGSDDLANTSYQSVCGDTEGHFILCPSVFSGSICGNNTVEPGEQCDDGNTTSGDGCSNICKSEASLPSVISMSVNSQPVAGGTLNTNVVCEANVSSPGGVAANIFIRYKYTFSNGGGNFSSTCSVLTDPVSGSGTDYPGQEFWSQDVLVTSFCLESADVPVDPAVTRC